MAISNVDQHVRSGEAELGLGTLLRMAYQAMMADGVEPALAAAGCDDLRAAHLPVFQELAANPAGLRSTELAARARITKQSMGSLVDHLAAGGYVERAPDPTDQRAKVVRLTPRGWMAGEEIRAAVREVERDWAERAGAEQVACLRSTLQALVAGPDR